MNQPHQRTAESLAPRHAAFFLTAPHGYQGWVLAGHTHGGQCKLPFLRPPRVPVENPRYVAGEVDVGDGRRLYINRALGHLLPVRFNVRPEITAFRLRRAV